jgi:hypothetical protein
MKSEKNAKKSNPHTRTSPRIRPNIKQPDRKRNPRRNPNSLVRKNQQNRNLQFVDFTKKKTKAEH